MGKKSGWFDVDRDGLRALIAGKPKSLIIRELVQNGWDEPSVTRVVVDTAFKKGVATVTVTDDAPEGFVDLRHAYTLFADTRKRGNPEVRGRFNLGEKEVLSMALCATIITTKGGVSFDKDGTRRTLTTKRKRGSEVTITFQMTKDEYNEMLSEVGSFIPPKNIDTVVNGESLTYPEPLAVVDAKVRTEVIKDTSHGKVFKRVSRKTKISVYTPGEGETAMLFEMGLPVCETGDAFHYDVAQKVPMSSDRDAVPLPYLQMVRGEVINDIIDHVPEDDISAAWVRDALASNRIKPEAVKKIVEKRFGGKVVVATPGDSHGIEEAIRQGYRVVRSGEMSREEWANVRAAEAIDSTSHMFPETPKPETVVPSEMWTPEQKRTAEFAIWLADKLGIKNLSVSMYRSDTSTGADFNRGLGRMRFNLANLPEEMFKNPAKGKMLALIVHELGHQHGGHLEESYLKALCRIASKLPCIAIKNKQWDWC